MLLNKETETAELILLALRVTVSSFSIFPYPGH